MTQVTADAVQCGRGSLRSKILPHTKEAGDAYYIGDIYERTKSVAKPGETSQSYDPSRPYQSYVNRISQNWPYMQYLADFMNTTCAPPKQRFLEGPDRAERASRMNVCSLEFEATSIVKCNKYNVIEELRSDLEAAQVCRRSGSSPILFVVEDLSKDIIEVLGTALNVDPRFFRGHISEYYWYNIRDPWVELPGLETISNKCNFYHMRYFQARYFLGDETSLASEELGEFNVLRYVDIRDDRAPALDVEGSSVGLVRSKASFWVRSDPKAEFRIVGILLLDPTIKSGLPLWAGYGYLNEKNGLQPNREGPIPLSPTKTMFEQFIHWTQYMEHDDISRIEQDPRILLKYALLVICGHWKTVLEFARTRLVQVEWEIEDPTILQEEERNLEICLKRLQRWRRVLPIYHEFVTSILSRTLRVSPNDSMPGSLEELKPDINQLLNEIEALQLRAERVVSLVANMIAIEEAKKGVQQNQNLTRLTYLAVVFIPLQFMSSLFSMTNDLASIGHTLRLYFASAIPLTLVCVMAVAFVRLSPASWHFLRFARL